jgi:uncharacterized membrane protein
MSMGDSDRTIDDQANATQRQLSHADTVRLEALSDGVIAVAITLLVLDLRVPKLEGDQPLWNALTANWPSYAAYVTSFLVIGILWINHHSLFRQIRYATRGLMLANLTFLMLVVAIPFVTSLVSEYLQEGNWNSKVAMATYDGLALAIALSITFLWAYVLRRPALLEPSVDVAAARKAFPQFSIGIAVYTVLIVLAFINPVIALAGTFGVALYYCFEHLPSGRSTQT